MCTGNSETARFAQSRAAALNWKKGQCLEALTINCRAPAQIVCPWKLQSSHLDSSSIFQKVLSHSPVSSFFSLIHKATCIIRRGTSQSLHKDSTVSSSSRGREVLLKS